MHEAKSSLSKLVERAAAGEDVIIGKAGRPVARLTAYVETREPRQSGALRRDLWMAEDFDETPDWLIEAFEQEA